MSVKEVTGEDGAKICQLQLEHEELQDCRSFVLASGAKRLKTTTAVSANIAGRLVSSSLFLMCSFHPTLQLLWSLKTRGERPVPVLQAMFKFANRMRRGATYHASVFLSEACMSKSSTLLIGLSVPIVYSRSFQSTALCTAAAAAAVTSPSSTVVETDSGSGRMKIYQYKICPFCNRVKVLE